jgi:hypothetical protein
MMRIPPPAPIEGYPREWKIVGRIGDFWFTIVRPTPES